MELSPPWSTPAVPKAVLETVHRLARECPEALREPGSALPWLAAYEMDRVPGALKGADLFFAAALASSPVSYLIMMGMQKAQGVDPVSLGGFATGAVYVYLVLGLLIAAVAWLQVHIPGGRRAVEKDLAAAQGRYLLHGTDIHGDDLKILKRAQDAVNSALEAARFTRGVELQRWDAFAAAIWSVAQGLAADEPQGDAWAMVIAIEEYAELLAQANDIWQRELDAKTWRPEAASPALGKAVKAANHAGASAVALATG
ncbi:hypothetical protein ACFQ1I_46490 [Kitasatospora arboriphila]